MTEFAQPTIPDDATVVKPASRAHGDEPYDSSLNRASWQRVAQAQGGPDATVGMLLKGRFMLVRELGRGGMGVVYLARDERKVEARDRDPFVAVKVLNDEFRRHPDSMIALQREARRAQRIADDHIVHVYDFDKDGTIVFMTMEYIDGTDLRTLIRERASDGMRLSEAWPLIQGMAHALRRAHASGIVHADFKPGNVMVTRGGVPKVFDFGIARAAQSGVGTNGDQTVFDAGTLGALTPAYASLEMLSGAHPVARDDVYALGCVVYELLTGRHPYDGLSASAALQQGKTPPSVPGLSSRQSKALRESVAFERIQRLQSVDALIDGLRPRRPRELVAPFVVGGVIVAILGAVGIGIHHQLREQQIQTTIERFAPNSPHPYANESEASEALDALERNERERIVLEKHDAVERFLLRRLDAYWTPTLGRIDFAGAERVLALRDQLRLFSPTFDARGRMITHERDEMLARLGFALDDAIDRDVLFEDEPGSAAAILGRIRTLDPDSALLKDPRLERHFDAAIGQSIDEGRWDEARARLTVSLRLFPNASRLQRRSGQLAAALAYAAAHPDARPDPDKHNDALRALAGLEANPSADTTWLTGLDDAMTVLRGDPSPTTAQTLDKLADATAATVAPVFDPARAPQSLKLVDAVLRYDPLSPTLAAQRARLKQLTRAPQLDRQIAQGDEATLIDAIGIAEAANDAAHALAALNRLRSLQPNSTFLWNDGPQLVAAAFIGNARLLCREGKVAEASTLAAQGADALPDDAKLADAAQRYALAAAILAARDTTGVVPDIEDLSGRYAAALEADPIGMHALDSDVGTTITLPNGGLRALLDQIRARTGDAQGASGVSGASSTSGHGG